MRTRKAGFFYPYASFAEYPKMHRAVPWIAAWLVLITVGACTVEAHGAAAQEQAAPEWPDGLE